MRGEKYKMRSTKMKVTRILMTVFCLTVLMALAHDTSAQDLRRLRCRTRVNPARDQVTISVENLLAGEVVTGTITNPAGASVTSAPVPADVAGNVDIVFDSQVVAGVTPIPANFVVSGNTVSGVVNNAANGTVIVSGTAVCQ